MNNGLMDLVQAQSLDGLYLIVQARDGRLFKRYFQFHFHIPP